MKYPSKVALLSAVSLFALSACSSTQDKAVPGTNNAVNVTYEYKRDRVQEQIDNIPFAFNTAASIENCRSGLWQPLAAALR